MKNDGFTAGCLKTGLLNIRSQASFTLSAVCFPLLTQTNLRFLMALRLTMDMHSIDASNEIFYIYWA